MSAKGFINVAIVCAVLWSSLETLYAHGVTLQSGVDSADKETSGSQVSAPEAEWDREEFFTRLSNQIKSFIYKQSDKVIIGKDGWLLDKIVAMQQTQIDSAAFPSDSKTNKQQTVNPMD